MAQVSVAKAMKLKNRLAGRLAQASCDIKSNNSRFKGMSETVNVRKRISDRESLVAALLDVKCACFNALTPTASRNIRLLGEKKAELTLVQSLVTTEGVQENAFAEKNFEYVCVVNKEEKDAWIKRLEGEVDELQDWLDEFNAKTKVDLQDETIELSR